MEGFEKEVISLLSEMEAEIGCSALSLEICF